MGNSVCQPTGLRAEDPTVKAQFFTWSSQEFHNEYALVYTSRSDPSLTCLSYLARNYNKVRFILHDCLCVGNKVRIGIEFEMERHDNGLLAFGPPKVDTSSGSFLLQGQLPVINYFWVYRDQFKQRVDLLRLRKVRNGSWEIEFRTQCGRNTILAYNFHLVFNPLKGPDVNISYPHIFSLFLGGFLRNRQPEAFCHVDIVSGKPPHDVLKHASVVPNSGTSDKIGKQAKQRESGEEKQENNNDGAPPGPTQKNNVIMNKGTADGDLNGSIFNINFKEVIRWN